MTVIKEALRKALQELVDSGEVLKRFSREELIKLGVKLPEKDKKHEA